jgi:phage terminase large subunit-like protein
VTSRRKAKPASKAARKSAAPKRKARAPATRKGPTRASRNIAWIETYCRVPEGRNVGKPLKVAPFMREDFRAIYDNPHGTRTAIISRGRKNAKTVEAALLVLLHTVGPEARPNSQVCSAAQSRDQAALLFDLAAKMVRMSPVLNSYVKPIDSKKMLVCQQLGTVYNALSADAATNLGKSPSLIVHDELGQVKGPRSALFDALETATAAQEDPMSIIISTQAPVDADLLSVLIDHAATGRDKRTVLRLNTAPPELDPFSVKAIRAANPAFDVFMNKAEVLSMAEAARDMPSRQAAYENLVLNRRIETFQPLISRVVWDRSKGKVLEDFDGLDVYAGLDLSKLNDLTALVLQAKHEGRWHVKPTFWLPKVGLEQRSRDDRVPYDLWAKQGHLIATPGDTIDYEFVAAHLVDLFARYALRKVAFDRWNFKNLKPCLQRAGLSEEFIKEHFVEFGQGYQSMSPALNAFEADLVSGKIVHDGNPVLTMCVGNAVGKPDPAGNRKPDKEKSRGRIDGVVAMIMAHGAAATAEVVAPRTFEIRVL